MISYDLDATATEGEREPPADTPSATRMDSSVSLRNTPSTPATLPAAHAPEGDLRLSGTAALDALQEGDPRLHALRQACALLEALEGERRQLDQRLTSANRLDPMRVVTGRTALDEAVEDTRALIRQLDEILCEAAELARRQNRPAT